MPDDIPVTPPQTAEHQLDRLPELPAETPVWRHPGIWILIIFFISTACIVGIIGWLKMDATVGTAFIGASGTLHTWVGVGLMGDKVARKVPYMMAANKDGITTPVISDPAQP